VGLGGVHGHVGLAEDGVYLGGLAHGDADAGPDLDLPAVEGEGGPHRLQDAPGDPDRDLVAGGLLEQGGELVAAQAGHGVLAPDAGLEPAGHGDQEVVAGGVAELVVDRLEVVQVDEEQGQGRAGLGTAAQGVGHPFSEQGPVGQVVRPSSNAWCSSSPTMAARRRLRAWLSSTVSSWRPTISSTRATNVQYRKGPGGLAPQLLEGRGGHGQGQREIGQHDLEPARPPPDPGDPDGCRPAGRGRHQQGAGEPADVGQGPGRVGPLLGEVGEAGVGHGQAEQAGPEQQDGDAADPDAGHDDEHDRGQDHVPGRVGEHDGLLEHAALAGPEHRAEHQRPADVQQRGGDHGPVQQRPRLEDSPFGPSREGQHGRHGQGDGPQVADVGQRREGQLALGQVLVPQPDGPGPAVPFARARDAAQAQLAAATDGASSWARLAVSLTDSSLTGRTTRNARKARLAPTASQRLS
jgi:hypothetical protein